MNRPNDERTAISILVCFACLSLAAMCVAVRACESRASAQDSPAHGGPAVVGARTSGAEKADDGTVSLVRTVVGEADFNATDHAAILYVLQARSDRVGVPLVEMAKRYSAVWKGSPSPRIRWVMQLEPTCSAPADFPANLKWAHWRERCRQAFGTVRAYLRGELANPCPGARHFGGMRIQADRDRMVRAVRAKRWRVVKCSAPTVNTFLSEVRT